MLAAGSSSICGRASGGRTVHGLDHRPGPGHATCWSLHEINLRARVVRMTKRLGFFTRLLDEANAAERYRLATAQIVQAERSGFDSAWIAQHHFHEAEGGLPAPFVFLTHAAAATSRIRLGTGIVTLPLELPVRVAEDAVVLDLLSNHRLQVGVGPGGNLTAFTAFGLDAKDRHSLMNANLDLMRTAWAGGP